MKTNFLNHLNSRYQNIETQNRENIQHAKQTFFSNLGQGVETDKAFDEAIKTFQQKVNPSEDMAVFSQQVAQTAKDAIKPEKEDCNAWLDTLNAAAPMIQLYNEWIGHLNENKNASHVFYN